MKVVASITLLPALLVFMLPMFFGAGEDAPGEGTPEHPDLPEVATRAYMAAARRMADAEPSCPLSWALLAGIGKVETNHGRFGGSVPGEDGQVRPPILGVVLDGSLAGTRSILDTDGGRLDGNSRYDRAVGPMQFIPGTWARFGIDGNDDGIADPHNLFDATAAAAAYLCLAATDPIDTDSGRRQAVGAYNRSFVYVQEVLGWMTQYVAQATFPDDVVLADGTWVNPAPAFTRLSSGYGNRIHPISGLVKKHSGIDLSCPRGSPIIAAGAGLVASTRLEGGAGYVVWIDHPDGYRTRYLHLIAGSFTVSPGQRVQPGQQIARCGTTGNSTGPHLHFEVYRPGGPTLDPQPFMAERGVTFARP